MRDTAGEDMTNLEMTFSYGLLHTNVCKQISSDSFKNMTIYKLLIYKSYI